MIHDQLPTSAWAGFANLLMPSTGAPEFVPFKMLDGEGRLLCQLDQEGRATFDWPLLETLAFSGHPVVTESGETKTVDMLVVLARTLCAARNQ